MVADAGQCVSSATISAWEYGQQWVAAVDLLRNVQQCQMQTYALTHGASISACEKCQNLAWMRLLYLSHGVFLSLELGIAFDCERSCCISRMTSWLPNQELGTASDCERNIICQ